MRRIVQILILLNFIAADAHTQSFTVDELAKLTNLPLKNIGHYMNKKGFVLSDKASDSAEIKATFIQKFRFRKETDPKRSIDIFLREGIKHFTLHTTDFTEYQQGIQKLIKSGFFYDTLKDVTKGGSVLFQKANINIQGAAKMQDSSWQCSLILIEKAIPATLRYADDLLHFDSHAFLSSYFGKENVKRDIFYFEEKEFKRCSVLFGGTQRQAVFVWEDSIYLNKLLYILVTNKLPTEAGLKSNPLAGNNLWRLKSGVYVGMELKELLKINEVDFDIYGNKSEMAFLIQPNSYGKIDFKKTAVMLSCNDCDDHKIFNQRLVSALDVAKAKLQLRVLDIALYPEVRH